MNASPRQRSRFLRFSLRTLLCFALTVGAVATLIHNRAPWVLELDLKHVFLSPDKTRAVVRDPANGTMWGTIWDTERGRKLCSVQTLPGGYARPVFSRDSRRVALWSDTTEYSIFEPETGASAKLAHVTTIPAHGFSPDGTRVLAYGDNRCWSVYDTRSGERLFLLDEGRPLLDARFTSSGKLMVMRVGGVAFADSTTGNVNEWIANECIEPALSAGKNFIAIVQNGDLKIYDVSRHSIRECEGCRDIAQFLVRPPYFSENGKYLIAETKDYAHIIDPQTGAEVDKFQQASDQFESNLGKYVNRDQAKSRVGEFANNNFALDANRYVTVSFGAFFVVKETNSKRVLAIFGHSGTPPFSIFSSDLPPFNKYGPLNHGTRVFAFSDDNELKTYVNRRPEYWWGYAWLPEFWLAAAFLCLFAWSLLRDWRVPA
ncbi:MAG TPA: WD40 repeat domain-containing protein [Planctomycetota bacterium]|nr:WD40 repeat domain-containing protein [Planctomycetota bacterium]